MDLVDELEKLSELYSRGALSEEEFSRAKAVLLAGGSAGTEPSGRDGSASPNQLGSAGAMAAIRDEQELARLDRDWEREREPYMIRGRYGSSHVPGAGDVVGPVLVGLFGIFWCFMAISMTRMAPGEGPFPVLKIVFPLFGVIFTIMAVVVAVRNAGKLSEYRSLKAAYDARRDAMRR